MANTDHVAIARLGARAIRDWLVSTGFQTLDLRGADLRDADLAGAELGFRVDLNGAQLSRANLSFCQCFMTKMKAASLQNACLERASFSHADLRTADLTGANLQHVRLAFTKLERAVLKGADLHAAVLAETSLVDADLSESDLGEASFFDCDLRGVDFSRARSDLTTYGTLDLSMTKGLETLVHDGPSVIGVDTLLKSRCSIPDAFLSGCGVPYDLVRHLRLFAWQGTHFFSCFISYCEADEQFSSRLYKDLLSAGIRCWRWKEDARWGRTLMSEVDTAVRSLDKLVLVCSENSLNSEAVIREVERALQRETRERREVLFPIRIDDAVLTWNHALSSDILRKNIGDFRAWNSPAGYAEALRRLIDNLRADS